MSDIGMVEGCPYQHLVYSVLVNITHLLVECAFGIAFFCVSGEAVFSNIVQARGVKVSYNIMSIQLMQMVVREKEGGKGGHFWLGSHLEITHGLY